MKKSIELIKDIINKNKISQYHLAEESNIERSLLSKMLNGSRSISINNFLSLLEALPIDSISATEIVDSFISENYGFEKYKNMIQSLENFQAPFLDSNLFNPELLIEKKSVIQTNSGLMAYISLIVNNSEKFVFTNLPASLLLSTVPIDNKVDIKILYSTDRQDNLNIFDVLNLFRRNCVLYKPLKQTTNVNSTDVFPYYLVADEKVLIMSENLDNGIYFNDKILSQIYTKLFNEKISLATNNIQTVYSEISFEESTINLFYGADYFGSISSVFPIVFCMDRELWTELAKDDLPNRQYLIDTTSKYYHTWVESTDHLEYITKRQGMIDFCNTGITELMPFQYQKPLSIESRIKVLEKMLYELEHNSKKFSLRLINDKHAELLDFLFIEVAYNENDMSPQAVRCMKRSNNENSNPYDNAPQFLVTDKELCKDFFKFFQLFQASSYFLTKKETKHAIAQQISKMKFLLQGDNKE
ncbi:MAG: helix-turn-helix domain-containing protein [Acutalibacteraceae bacterium]